MDQEFEDVVASCHVGFGAYVKARELVFVVDRVGEHMAVVLAWNDVPTVYVQRTSDNKQEEVEPWRIKKIQKQA